MRRKISLILGLLAALMLPSETFAKHGGGHGHGGHGGHGHGGHARQLHVGHGHAGHRGSHWHGRSIGMGTAIGTDAIGVGMAIGIGGTVDGGPMVLALVGEWFLAAGFGSVTDDPTRAETLHLSEKLFPLITTKRGQIGTSVEHPQRPQGYFSEQQEIPTTSPRSTASAARRLVS